MRIPAKVGKVGTDVQMTVNVCIDGKGPFPFAVDTGASSSSIDAGLANRLKLPRVGKVESFSGAGCTGKGQERRIASWSVAGVPLQAQTATGQKVPHLGGPGEPDGLLGSDVWARFGAVRFDFRHGEIVVPGPEQAAPTKQTVVKKPASSPLPAGLLVGRPRVVVPMTVAASPAQTLIFVAVAFGSHPGTVFTPDTGASTSAVDSNLAKQAGLKPTGVRAKQSTVCSIVTVPAVASGRWTVAGQPLASAPIYAVHLGSSGPPRGLLGADQMNHYGSVVFDYHGGRLVLGAG